ncbi:MAG TPA: gamma-carboxygeranoyl-CoA hydratase [Legionellales bacterium]|nr:gamma-carboxygeranoyl-CoA hydratase [Legionellales bacterium]HCA89593.1 gamma-carboxygeranoyl-CoA hydratase [Legionellales bacterium]|tara:strand:- start:1036 stop:1809 length:774 start_codon:yes stop_codon:yes gene_type:complete
MTDLICEHTEALSCITLNRPAKHNAFDDALIAALTDAIRAANEHPDTRVLVIKAQGPNFSSGADLAWMKRMSAFTKAQNKADALALAHMMQALFNSEKPTIAAVQGLTMGGGVGLVAACDLAFASMDACFCFSEVKLGLIPAVISPYIMHALGAREAKRWFLTAEKFDAVKAKSLGLVHEVVHEDVVAYALDQATQLAKLPIHALKACKSLVNELNPLMITPEVLEKTATSIAKQRVSSEAQAALQAFLTKSSTRGV